MIDLHCHLLPGLDDGPADDAGALELARVAAAQGTRLIAATPHCREDHPAVRPAELPSAVAAMRKQLSDAGIGVDVVQGGELGLRWALDASKETLDTVSLGGTGRYLLVETPYTPLTATFEQMLFDLTLRGYDVLLAHPENNPSFHAEPERLAELVRRGVLLQVTARALAGTAQGARMRTRFARDMVKEGLVHVIATDAHSGGRFRPPLLAEGRDAARDLVGPRGDWMVEEVPVAILAGADIPEPPPREVPRNRRRRLLRRR